MKNSSSNHVLISFKEWDMLQPWAKESGLRIGEETRDETGFDVALRQNPYIMIFPAAEIIESPTVRI